MYRSGQLWGVPYTREREVRWSSLVTFDDRTVEGGTCSWDHVKLAEEKLGATLVLVLCVVEWQKTVGRVDRERWTSGRNKPVPDRRLHFLNPSNSCVPHPLL